MSAPAKRETPANVRRLAAVQRLVRVAGEVTSGECVAPGLWRLQPGAVLSLRLAREEVLALFREVRR